MLRRLIHFLLLGGGLLVAGSSGAFLIGPPTDPPTDSPATSQQESEFDIGYDLGYKQGFGRGLKAGVAECVADPRGCGIALNIDQPAGDYGETEPNDNMATADLLAVGEPFRGQSLAQQDQDWFKINIPGDNRALMVNFALADIAAGNLSGWTLSVRDAFGNTFTEVDTGFMAVANTLEGVDYRLTLGRSGVYYIVLRPSLTGPNPQQYLLTATLNPTPTLPDDGVPVGFFDAESEPNDTYQEADRITKGIAMYGLVNLEFSAPVPGDPTYTWGQGEDDWFVYSSPGHEVAQIAFCDRQVCSAGNWLVQFFDEARAMDPWSYVQPYENPADPFDTAALVSFNTTSCGGDPCAPSEGSNAAPDPWHVGLQASGDYFIRVNHKRKFDAPCVGYETDMNNDGVVGPNPSGCGCDSGYSCALTVANPDPIPIATEISYYPPCPDGSGGGDSGVCTSQCLRVSNSGLVDADDNGIPDTPGQSCRCAGDTFPCDVTIPNPGDPIIAIIDGYPLCPDGTGGGTIPICQGQCIRDESTSGLVDANGDGLPDNDARVCGCPSGSFPCTVTIGNPGNPTVTVTDGYPVCPDGSGGGASPVCQGDCVLDESISGVVDENNNGIADDTQQCGCPDDSYPCETLIPNEGEVYPLCPNGTGGGEDVQCEFQCLKEIAQGYMDTDNNGIADILQFNIPDNVVNNPNDYYCSCPDNSFTCNVVNPDNLQEVECLQLPDRGLLDVNGDGRTDGIDRAQVPDNFNLGCNCPSNSYPCAIVTDNPGEKKTATQPPYPVCEDDTGGGNNAFCGVTCLQAPTGSGGIDLTGDGLPDGIGACKCPLGQYPCSVTVENPENPNGSQSAIYPACPNGTGGGDSGVCEVDCLQAENNLGGIDLSGDGRVDDGLEPCACSGGSYPCAVTAPNPGDPGETEAETYPACPNGEGGGTSTICSASCLAETDAGVLDMNRDGLPDAGACNCPGGSYPCTAITDNPSGMVTETQTITLCPDGSEGENNGFQCEIGCLCTRFGGVVEVPEEEFTSQYNFSLITTPFGTAAAEEENASDN